jgi:hypothetical protein
LYLLFGISSRPPREFSLTSAGTKKPGQVTPLGPVLEVTVDNVVDAKKRLVEEGCEVVKDEPDFPRCYIKDPFGLIYNLTS